MVTFALASASLEGWALILGSFATFLTALGGFIVVLHNQRRTHRSLDAVYNHVNNVEAGTELREGAEPTTLGEAVHQVRTEIREGFARNDAEHALFRTAVDALDSAVRANRSRIDAHRTELDTHQRRLDVLFKRRRKSDDPPSTHG